MKCVSRWEDMPNGCTTEVQPTTVTDKVAYSCYNDIVSDTMSSFHNVEGVRGLDWLS